MQKKSPQRFFFCTHRVWTEGSEKYINEENGKWFFLYFNFYNFICCCLCLLFYLFGYCSNCESWKHISACYYILFYFISFRIAFCFLFLELNALCVLFFLLCCFVIQTWNILWLSCGILIKFICIIFFCSLSVYLCLLLRGYFVAFSVEIWLSILQTIGGNQLGFRNRLWRNFLESCFLMLILK